MEILALVTNVFLVMVFGKCDNHMYIKMNDVTLKHVESAGKFNHARAYQRLIYSLNRPTNKKVNNKTQVVRDSNSLIQTGSIISSSI